jgi:hypothetical protein
MSGGTDILLFTLAMLQIRHDIRLIIQDPLLLLVEMI